MSPRAYRAVPPSWVRVLGLILLTSLTSLAAQDSDDCLSCHGDQEMTVEEGKPRLFFDEDLAEHSVHADLDCIDCHDDLEGVEDFPHEAKLEPASCDACHDDAFKSIADYWGSTHGKLVEEGDDRAPNCGDCHGNHYIRKRSDPKSAAHLLNVPAMCTQCHASGQPVERAGELSHDEIVARYKDNIHGGGLFARGLTVSPVCTTCHSAHGVLPYTDPNSTIHKDRVNDTCAQCHADNVGIHRGIIAEEAWTKPELTPLCVDCHQPHSDRKISYGTKMSNVECLECHGDQAAMDERGHADLFVDVEQLGHSVHGRKLIACAQCHVGAAPADDQRSCKSMPGEVNCAICHDGVVQDYHKGIHGSLAMGGDADAPRCVDCHGRHDIMESASPEGAPDWLHEAIDASPTHRRNVPELCSSCHGGDGVAAERLGNGEKVDAYRDSIHGKGLIDSGLTVSANCVDCHSAHMQLPDDHPDSTVSSGNTVHTCGKCHDGIDDKFGHSIHSRSGNPEFVAVDGEPGLPDCNDCHTAHSVTRTDQADFKLGMIGQCAECHAEITETYFQTQHGKLSTLGNTVAARCEDCHGSHEIAPVGDPRSPLHKDNIVATCGKCHEGSHEGFTTYLAHGSHDDPENYPALYWAFTLMTWLLVGVFSFFGLHVLAWLPRSIALRREMKREHELAKAAGVDTPEELEYRRFTFVNRMLHIMVIVSFLGLTITGMSLKFSQAGWARFLMDLMGGTENAGWIHRFCAVITFAYFTIHLYDLSKRFIQSKQSIQQFFFGPNTMIPGLRDVKDFTATMKWFFGLGPRPSYPKWTYWEKFDYFAVFWGVLIIGGSGLILWFPVQATWILPGWTINVATIIHSEEALLATGFIFTIHFFNTHLRPEKFPLDPVVFTGTMSVEELKTDKADHYRQLVESGELEKHLIRAPRKVVKRRAYIFGTIALTIGVIMLILLIHGLVTVGL